MLVPLHCDSGAIANPVILGPRIAIFGKATANQEDSIAMAEFTLRLNRPEAFLLDALSVAEQVVCEIDFFAIQNVFRC